MTKRKFADMEDRLQTLEELYEILRSKNETVAMDIFRRIRAGDDAGTILRYLKDGDLLLQISLVPESWYRYTFPYSDEIPSVLLQHHNNPYLESAIYKWSTERPETERRQSEPRDDVSDYQTQYMVPYHAARLVDHRIDKSMPSKWTIVTSNEELLRELLNIYFLFEYSAHPFFNRDFFLDDLVSGRERFCSSLLVNVILAAACVSLALPIRRQVYQCHSANVCVWF